MATKKQKRQRGLKKHEEEMAELRRLGLEALRKDRQHRRQKELQEWEENHKKNHSWQKRIVECPHCRLEMKDAEKEMEKATSSTPESVSARS